MECRIENEHLRSVRHNSRATFDSHEVCACVKRGKVAAELELSEDFGSYKAAFKEVRTAVNDTVTDRLDFAHILYAAEIGICEILNNGFHGNRVVGHSDIVFDFCSVRELMLDDSVNADSLADALGENLGGFCVEKLILKRRASRIYNKYFHFLLFSSVSA